MTDNMLWLDHLVVACDRLASGTAHVEELLGVPLVPGGKHARMATHNTLLSLGDCYLEAIAPDPGRPSPDRPRWFDLDNFSGPPRLTHWAARCADLEGLQRAMPALGDILTFRRGDLEWQMLVPPDGCLPFGGCFPAPIRWISGAHPATGSPATGCRLIALTLTHPQADELRAAFARRITDPRLVIAHGASPRLAATVATPDGNRRI